MRHVDQLLFMKMHEHYEWDQPCEGDRKDMPLYTPLARPFVVYSMSRPRPGKTRSGHKIRPFHRLAALMGPQ